MAGHLRRSTDDSIKSLIANPALLFSIFVRSYSLWAFANMHVDICLHKNYLQILNICAYIYICTVFVRFVIVCTVCTVAITIAENEIYMLSSRCGFVSRIHFRTNAFGKGSITYFFLIRLKRWVGGLSFTC